MLVVVPLEIFGGVKTCVAIRKRKNGKKRKKRKIGKKKSGK